MTEGCIHIACAADAAYFPHAGTLLASVLAFNRHVHAYVLCGPDVAQADRDRMSTWAASRGAVVECLVPEVRLPASLPGIPRLTRAAWLRLFLPELLPNLSRVLYLDVDMIVHDSLDEIWNLDLGNKWIAAVTDIPKEVGGMLCYRRVGFTDSRQYFNTGVLLMDLDRFRAEHVTDRALRFAAENPDKVALADQDPLNAVLHEHRYVLPLRWNALSPLHEGGIIKGEFPFSADEVRAARTKPAVVHFSGIWKPWHYRSKHPLRKLYAKYRKQGPWPDWSVEGCTLKHAILRLFPESTQWWLTERYWSIRGYLGLSDSK